MVIIFEYIIILISLQLQCFNQVKQSSIPNPSTTFTFTQIANIPVENVMTVSDFSAKSDVYNNSHSHSPSYSVSQTRLDNQLESIGYGNKIRMIDLKVDNHEVHNQQENGTIIKTELKPTEPTDDLGMSLLGLDFVDFVKSAKTTFKSEKIWNRTATSSLSSSKRVQDLILDQASEEEVEEWLNQHDLSSFTTKELEELAKSYFSSVVTQLVHVASQNDDLTAELDTLDPNGYAFIHYCCLLRLTTLVPQLLSKGASVNIPTQTGTTALHFAAATGQYDLVKFLVQRGANISVVDAQGFTPADLAMMNHFDSIYNFLSQVSKLYVYIS